MDKIICGHCGTLMTMREIAPCLDCGGRPVELEHLKSGQHEYLIFELFDGDVLCDLCYVDMPSTNPLSWGFPEGFNWDINLDKSTEPTTLQKLTNPQPRREMACPNIECGFENTLRKQIFILKNAKRHGVILPEKYWPFINDNYMLRSLP